VIEKKIVEDLSDLICANCVYSDEGSDEGFVTCCKDQESMAGQTEFQSDSFCGDGYWSLEVNEGTKMTRYSCLLQEAVTILLNGGDIPWDTGE